MNAGISMSRGSPAYLWPFRSVIMVGIFDPWVRWVPRVCEIVAELLLLEREKSGIVNGRRRYRDSKSREKQRLRSDE